MWDFLRSLMHAKTSALLVIFGMFLIAIAVIGAVQGKFDPGPKGRLAAGALGLLCLAGGILPQVVPLRAHPSFVSPGTPSPAKPSPRGSQDSFVDDPPGLQEPHSGTSVHVCPAGYAMSGVKVDQNRFTCQRVIFPGMEGRVHTILDPGTQQNYGRGNMHVCPTGMYMRGLHDRNNWLVCSDGVGLSRPSVDANGATHRNGMHMCPMQNGRQAVMTGIQISRNDFSCAIP
jgi:hypothetical protein